MKKLYFAITVLICCAALCVFEQITINNVYSEVISLSNEALYYADSGDYENTQKVCAKLKSYWESKHTVLSSLIEHDELDQMSLAVNSMEEITPTDFEELPERIIEAKSQIEIIKQDQSVTLGNIF